MVKLYLNEGVFFILLSWAWIMEHHEPYQAFWRVGFYVSYQVERPEAQCHAVFLCRAHSLAANLCHPHIFLIRRDQDQLISHTKFPAQLLEQHPSTSERLSEHISSKWPFNVKRKLVLSGETDYWNKIYFALMIWSTQCLETFCLLWCTSRASFCSPTDESC